MLAAAAAQHQKAAFAVGSKLSKVDRLAKKRAVEFRGALIAAGDADGLRIADDEPGAVGDIGVARQSRLRRVTIVVQCRFSIDEVDAPFDPRVIRRHLADKLQSAAGILQILKHAKPGRLRFIRPPSL